MDLTPWNPWQELERVQGQVDDLLASVLAKLRNVVPGKAIAFVPATDIVELAGEYRLYLSLPGIVEEDIDITLEADILIVRGEREAPYGRDQAMVHQAQWKYGYFERRIHLPRPVEEDSIHASYDAGVLTIRVPKVPAEGGKEGES